MNICEQASQALPLRDHFTRLVCFDHVLDVVGRGFQLAVDFAHVNSYSTLYSCTYMYHVA